ncbi:MAG: zinc ribbon domain-containing protein [Hungatella sp.]
MNTKDVLKNIRIKNNLTQDEMAEKLSVTRQAVSRWETGDSTPNIETLKQISIAFDISINTLLGSPRQLICQCCGMPLEDDSVISQETDNSFNEDYCKWCYTDGQFVYKNMDELLDFLVSHMSNDNFTPEQAKAYFSEQLPKLKHWK